MALNHLKQVKKKKKISELTKLKNIRTLWYQVYISEKPLADMAVEFFHAIGEILEGISPKKIRLKDISRKEIDSELIDE